MAFPISGITPYRFLSDGSTKAGVIKASAGMLHSFLVAENIGAAAVYLRLYDMATAPATTDTPVCGPIVIPGATTGAGVVIPFPEKGLSFSTGIAWRLTTAIADNADTATNSAEVAFSTSYT